MSQEENIALKYVPGQVDELVKTTEKINQLQSRADNLAEMAALDIIEGETTGDKLLDFAIVACGGVYDEYVINSLYRGLHDLGLRRPGQKILLIQKGRYINDDIHILRNIHLATLRADTLEFDLDSLLVKLPVEPGRLIWREFMNTDGDYLSGWQIHEDKWLPVGPILNEHCDFGNAKRKKDLIFVSKEAPFETEMIPESDKLDLYDYHDIDADLLDYLTGKWIRELSRL